MELVANLTLRTGIQLTYVQGYGIHRHLILPAGVLALRGEPTWRAASRSHKKISSQDWIPRRAGARV